MNILNVQQGSPEWLAARAKFFTASEASAMLGISSYKTRTQLLDEKASGITPEVDAATQARFNKGHAVEEMARPIAEEIIGEELFPVTGTSEIEGLPLLASCDGLTMLEDIGWEHKLLNQKLRDSLSQGVIPDEYHPQMAQQILVTGAEKILFMASDGTKENCLYAWFTLTDKLKTRLIDGWTQFGLDLVNHTLAEKQVKPEGKKLLELPAINIQLAGGVTASNLDFYKEKAKEFIESINTNLTTDQEFADAEAQVKFLKSSEDKIKAAKEQALSQTSSIDELMKALDFIGEEMRQKRLSLDKLVKNKKEKLKADLVKKGLDEVQLHLANINAELNPYSVAYEPVDLAGAIKGKRNLEAMRDAISTTVANAKIAFNKTANQYKDNLNSYAQIAEGFEFLFSDLQQYLSLELVGFEAFVKNRIAEYKAEQTAKEVQEAQKAQAKPEAEPEFETVKQSDIGGAVQLSVEPEVKLAPNTSSSVILKPKLEYEFLPLWPSDIERAENPTLDEVCRHLEDAEQIINSIMEKVA